MLSEKISNKVTLVVYATVLDLFAMFLNPKNRGENFSWKTFPSLAQKMVKTQLLLSVVIKNTKQEKEAHVYGEDIAYKIAKRLVDQMTEE